LASAILETLKAFLTIPEKQSFSGKRDWPGLSNLELNPVAVEGKKGQFCFNGWEVLQPCGSPSPGQAGRFPPQEVFA